MRVKKFEEAICRKFIFPKLRLHNCRLCIVDVNRSDSHISFSVTPPKRNLLYELKYFFYLSNWPTWCTKFCFTVSLFHAFTCFEQHVLIVRRSKLYYTASDIITPIGGRPVHRLREDCSPLSACTPDGHLRCDDTRGCIVQFWPPDDEHAALETCKGMK